MYYTRKYKKGRLRLEILPLKVSDNKNLAYAPAFKKAMAYNPSLAPHHSTHDYFIKRAQGKNSPRADEMSDKDEKLPKRFELQDFNKISRRRKEAAYETVPDGIKSLVNTDIGLGIAFKQTLDKKYGEGNYKFVSLGTSPACVAKAMELMGEDVVYLPMSFSSATCAKPWLMKSPYIGMYKEYMSRKGLTNENLEKEKKTAVICDYTFSGRSLELSEFMLTGPLGLDKNRVETATMNSMIENSPLLPREVKDEYLDNILKKEKTAVFCNVPHFSFLDKTLIASGKIQGADSLSEYFDTYCTDTSNVYNFTLMKALEDFNLLYNPDK